jgi:2'-5' RNA ligase
VVQSVELLLDADGDAAVRQDWERLRAAGLPSQGRITASSNRPHITVAVAARLATDAEDAIMATATRLAAQLPIGLVMGGLLLFPGRRTVLARSVVPAAELLVVHEAFAAALAPFAEVPDTMAPGRWSPHVTLARGVPEEWLPTAVDVVRHDPFDTSAMAIRRWDGSARREWIIAEAARAEGSTRG